MQSKVKITQKEFDEFYEIKGITGDTEHKSDERIVTKQDTTPTPEILTESEQEIEEKYEESLIWDEEKEE